MHDVCMYAYIYTCHMYTDHLFVHVSESYRLCASFHLAVLHISKEILPNKTRENKL